ncbi:MAG: hypothetical protein ACE5RJ_00630 [Nitrosopumilaceae archaeon]
MVLIDKKILFGGIAMLTVGIGIYSYLDSITPAGRADMTEEEVFDLMVAEQQNQDYKSLAGILIGVGFLLVLISFGARRRRKGGPKREEKKPAE